MKLNKYLVFALLFFFFNSIGLPFGLTYTALLAPFFYWWVLTSEKKEFVLPFLIVLLPSVIVQLSMGVYAKEYFISLFNFIAVYIFCHALSLFFRRSQDTTRIFQVLLIVNFVLCLIAIPLYFTHWSHILWIEQFLTQGVDSFRRLKMFTYEASYYSTLFTILFFFFIFSILLRKNRINSWLLLAMLVLPLLLSFSMGVISAILVAFLLTLLFHLRRLLRKRRTLTLLTLVFLGVVSGLVVLVVFFPGNVLFLRLNNIVTGHDNSGQGRTFDAFILADRILSLKNHFWGVGPGQIKIIGDYIIRDYYNYPFDYPVITIPNTVAETWTIFGTLGLIVRFGLEIFFFFYRRVWTNYYRLALFFFIFIYQFTGSFITNIAEYAIWIIAFSKAFPQFDVLGGRITEKDGAQPSVSALAAGGALDAAH